MGMQQAAPPLTVMTIAAIGRGLGGAMVIGRAGGIPWRSKADMAAFRAATTGHMVVMGARTYESLPSGALPGRVNYVVSRTSGSAERWARARAEGVAVVPNLASLIRDLTEYCPGLGAQGSPVSRRQAGEFPSGLAALDYSPTRPVSRILWVIGGAALYEAAMSSKDGPPMAQRAIFTQIDTDVPDGDTFFPPIDAEIYGVVGAADIPPRGGPACRMIEYARRGKDIAAFPPFLPFLLDGMSQPGAGVTP